MGICAGHRFARGAGHGPLHTPAPATCGSFAQLNAVNTLHWPCIRPCTRDAGSNAGVFVTGGDGLDGHQVSAARRSATLTDMPELRRMVVTWLWAASSAPRAPAAFAR